MFLFHSSVGVFWIKPHLGKFLLGINNDALGSYHSAVAAADDVYTHVTGHFPWDILDGIEDGPTDIYEWERN